MSGLSIFTDDFESIEYAQARFRKVVMTSSVLCVDNYKLYKILQDLKSYVRGFWLDFIGDWSDLQVCRLLYLASADLGRVEAKSPKYTKTVTQNEKLIINKYVEKPRRLPACHTYIPKYLIGKK